MIPKNEFNCLMEFLQMPLLSTEKIFAKYQKLPDAIHRGQGKEQFAYIRGRRNNRVLLIAHADTAFNHDVMPDLVMEDKIIRNNTGGLGADDRAGCAILWLLKDLGHSLLITDGEEDGLMGSKWIKNKNKDIFDELNDTHQFFLQFDRRNAKEMKCYGVGTEEFRSYVAGITGYTEPDRRYRTDIVVLCARRCGVNLSIGYYNEHTETEYLNIGEWYATLEIAREWLAQSQIPKFDLIN